MGRDSCQGTCYLSIMRATAALATLSASSWGMKHGVNMELSDAAPLVEYEGSSKSIAGSSNETVAVFGILVARAVGGQGGCCLRMMASLTAVSLLGALGGQDTLDIPDRSRWNAAPLACLVIPAALVTPVRPVAAVNIVVIPTPLHCSLLGCACLCVRTAR